MSSPENGGKATLGKRVIQIASLLAVAALLVTLGHFVPVSNSSAGLAAALGLLLLAGVLLSDILDLVHLPHLTGYLVAGVIAGPHVLHFIDHDTVAELSQVNKLALALIALAGGLELRMSTLRELRKSLLWASLVQTVLVIGVVTGVFFVLSRFIGFTRDLPQGAVVGVSLLWAVIAVSRSPSATLGILSQYRAEGLLTRYSLAFVMSSDILVVLLMAGTMIIAHPLITPGAGISLESLGHLGHEIYGSICVGTTLGLVLILYLKFVGRHLTLVLLLLGFGFTEGVHYLKLEPLLTLITTGFIVQNLSQQGEKMLHAIEETGAIVFVVFFATAGAHLDLPLLGQLWPVALALCFTRAMATFFGQKLSSKLAADPPVLKKWGWSSMISQAGLTLGMSIVIESEFPQLGTAFGSLVIATVAINEVVGPILFKLALDRSGEIAAAQKSHSS